MKLSLILHIAAEYLVILPGMFFCFIPVTRWLKLPPLRLYLSYSAALILLCLALGCIGAGSEKYYDNLFFLPLMLIFITVYFLSVHLDKLKLLYLFLCAAAVLSFGGLAGSITEAALYPDAGVYKLSDYGLIVQFVISFLFLGIFCFFRKKIVWIFENLHSKSIWRTIWTVPALIMFCNFMMEPVEYSNVWVGRIFFLYLIIETSLLFFFIFFQFMFYQTAKTIHEKYISEKTSLIYQIQANQYEALKNYMIETRHLRHDFKHVMMTVGELIQKEKYDEVKIYAERYYETFSDSGIQYSFCKNTAINALLSYYANIAACADIETKFEIRLQDKIHISDIDLSILFGNLLEHGLTAAKSVQSKKRYIRLTADTDTPGSLYIVMTNSFEKTAENDAANACVDCATIQPAPALTAKKKNSRLEEESAADLSSIAAIAEKYHGVAEFYEKDKEFVSNVMVSLL